MIGLKKEIEEELEKGKIASYLGYTVNELILVGKRENKRIAILRFFYFSIL